jgi:thiamine-monophosphate kinase
MNKQKTTVNQAGEFSLIDRLYKILLPQKNPDLLIGLGDDTAVIRMDKQKGMLATCDIQIENRHFRLDHTNAHQLGKRAAAVNLSDIASMGGLPKFALVSLGLPPHLTIDYYDELFLGMKEELGKHSAEIIGGNLARTEKELIIDIMLLGEVDLKNLLTRRGAAVDDRIFVTGNLGNASAGFTVLERYGKNYPPEFSELVQSHLLPQALVETGKAIASSGIATSMIDISDGIASDLYHICKTNRVGAEIYQDKVPYSKQVEAVARMAGKNPMDLVLHGGEDFQLLFTVDSKVSVARIDSLNRKLCEPVIEIGRILTDKAGFFLVDPNGTQKNLEPLGWDHFRPSKNSEQKE